MPGSFCQMSEYKGLGNAELWVLARGETGGRTVHPEAAGPEVSPSWYRDPIHGSNVPGCLILGSRLRLWVDCPHDTVNSAISTGHHHEQDDALDWVPGGSREVHLHYRESILNKGRRQNAIFNHTPMKDLGEKLPAWFDTAKCAGF